MGEPTVIDLFCGAGGLLAGLEASGWHTVAAVDRDPVCAATLRDTQKRRLRAAKGRRHLGGTRILCDDVADVTARMLRPKGAGSRWRPDLLVGGPPCQPFSSAGLQQGIADPRGRLFTEFVRLTGELRPRYVLFENVQGLVTAKSPDGRPGGVLRLVQSSFEAIGYACNFELLNAADYGAPQRRARVFMFATTDRALPDFPSPTHVGGSGTGLLAVLKSWVTLAEFLQGRPEPEPRDVVRPSASRAADLARLTPGTGLRATGIVEANRPGGHWGYRQDSFLADPRLPARTIRAASTPDWILLPDRSLRRLTWRECAGLQGFPDGWAFQGTAAARFRQIGNAVQGHLARALGTALLGALKENRRAQPTSRPWPAYFHRRLRYTVAEHAVNGAHREAAKQRRAS